MKVRKLALGFPNLYCQSNYCYQQYPCATCTPPGEWPWDNECISRTLTRRAMARQKHVFCVLPFHLPSHPQNQPPQQPHPDPHPIIRFPFPSLSRFLFQFDPQTVGRIWHYSRPMMAYDHSSSIYQVTLLTSSLCTQWGCNLTKFVLAAQSIHSSFQRYGHYNYSDYPFTWYQNIGSMFFRFVTKYTCDRRTERITIPETALAYMLRAVKIRSESRKIIDRTSNHVRTQRTLISAGTSCKSFSLRLGNITRVTPALWAANTFSLIPPTSSTQHSNSHFSCPLYSSQRRNHVFKVWGSNSLV